MDYVALLKFPPAVSADEGLRLGPEVVGRLPRLQPQG
jgi:hypothetical protein